MKPKNVWILGSTGSIGTQALDVIRRHPSRFQVAGIAAAGGNCDLLARQAAEFHVPHIAIAHEDRVDDFRAAARAYIADSRVSVGNPEEKLPRDNADVCPEILAGSDAAEKLVGHAQPEDVILNGITGSIGLAPTLASLHTGATLALANKESLVAGGALVQGAMVCPGQIVPVDSEHSAIFQALQSGCHHRGLTSPICDGRSNVRRIILTASGGPFRGYTRADLMHVTPEQALNHPTWNMGPVVTINSATLMNKALELIEAAYLFDVPAEDIVPVVHPQSAIHSAVEFIDGSTIAQASPPDMRLPIAVGLSWPERLTSITPSFDWAAAREWIFEPLDYETFPAVAMARDALHASPLHPAVMNAANEQAVQAFLQGRLSFLGIMDAVREVLSHFDPRRDAGMSAQTITPEKGSIHGDMHDGIQSGIRGGMKQSDTSSHTGQCTYAHVEAAQEWARRYADYFISSVQS